MDCLRVRALLPPPPPPLLLLLLLLPTLTPLCSDLEKSQKTCSRARCAEAATSFQQ
jgi:hypothetical protein